MEGGINAWNGVVAEGLPGQSLSFFASARSAEEYIALAWLLEDGTNVFYRSIGEMPAGREAAALFQELSVAEEHHKALLDDLSFRFSQKRIDPDSLRLTISGLESGRYIEGGLSLEEAIHRAEGRKTADILEMSITLEANAFDRYLFMRQEMTDARVKEVFTVLSNEEKTPPGKTLRIFSSGSGNGIAVASPAGGGTAGDYPGHPAILPVVFPCLSASIQSTLIFAGKGG